MSSADERIVEVELRPHVVAKREGVSERTVRWWCARGAVACRRRGLRGWLIVWPIRWSPGWAPISGNSGNTGKQ